MRRTPFFGRGAFCALLTVVALAACTSQQSTGAKPDQAVQKAARVDKPAVVASFYPLSEAAQRVGGDRVTVVNLTPAGSEPHYIELSPSTLDQVNRASLVLYLGKGFQPSVEKAAAPRGQAAVDVSEGLPLQQGVAEEGEEGGGAGQIDPHVWLDPTLMTEIVSKVEAALTRVDPAGRDAYAGNASRYRSELQQLDTEYRGGLTTCARRAIVTSHAAFGYLARRYGLQQQAIAGLSPESEPKPGRLARLAAQVKRDGTTTVFTEPLVSPKVAETFAREAGLRTAVLDPVEGLTDDELKAGKSYVTVMRDNLATLRTALGCQ